MKNLTPLISLLLIISNLTYSQITSTFDTNTENWQSEGDGDYYWEATTGNPDGCFRVNDDATGDMNRAYAPVQFLGDWSSATVTDYISADIFLHDMGGSYVSPNFVFKIVGPGGSAIALNDPIPTPPNDTWITYSVNLDETLWFIEDGTWTEIISHVSSFIVTMEYINGNEWNLLDNVILSVTPVQVPIEPEVCSDFESGLFEGWSSTESSKSIINSGGNPGRYLEINENTSGTALVVPSSVYHGNWSALDNHNAEIHIDYLITDIDGATYIHDFFVKISGPGGEATFPLDNSIEYAFNKWHSFGIPIESTGWTMLSGNWASLMNFVDDIQITAEFISGEETVGIDNFCISDSPPVADFSAEKTFVYLGETVQFYDNSKSAPQTWSWDFGDSGTSTEVNPTHLYSTPGNYTVSLTTTNYYGNNTETKTAYIEVYPVDECLKFEDDFEDPDFHPAWSFINGTWSIYSDGTMRQSSNYYGSTYDDACYAIAGSLAWENYIISCDFRSTDNDYVGFVFNYQDPFNMYMFRWDRQESLRVFSKYVNGEETILASDEVPYVTSTWYHMDIYTLMGTHAIVIDGIEIFSADDDSFTTGKIGLYCWGNQSGYWDNLKVECPGTAVEISAFLEGPTLETTMNTELNTENALPVTNPYTSSPWNHVGTEGVLNYTNPDVVDWVLVDFRDATSAANALPATSVSTKAGLLLNNGQIISPYGGLPLFFNAPITNSLYLVLSHRNHLSILSDDPLMDFGDALLYDFTSSSGQAYGTNAQKDLGNGIFGMYAGDFNADGIVNSLDKDVMWEVEVGKSGYIPSDCNLDGQADNLDKNDIWFGNIQKESQVPE